MTNKLPSCILLTSDDEYLSEAAELYTKKLFKLSGMWSFSRNTKKLPEEINTLLKTSKIDYLFNFLSPVFIPEDILKKITSAAINFHPAPPKWPGVGSASYALYEGDREFGATAHKMTKQFDAGSILGVLRFPILDMDTCDSLYKRALQYSLFLFYDVLYTISTSGNLPKSEEIWERKAKTRKEFEEFMTVSLQDSKEEVQKKIKAVRSSHFPGPFIEYKDFRFELPPLTHDK